MKLKGEPPAFYKAWVDWLFASPDHTRAFVSDPIAATKAANLECSPEDLARLIEAITAVTRHLHGRR